MRQEAKLWRDFGYFVRPQVNGCKCFLEVTDPVIKRQIERVNILTVNKFSVKYKFSVYILKKITEEIIL